MSKVAAYLQEHILGEVSVSPAVLAAMSTDASVLKIAPEMVVYPRVTNDIRKVARFCWQLAEKGHVLPITARGNGTDQTGAAIGKGVILSLPAHMNRIFEYEPKQKLVRLQPGVGADTLNAALSLHGAAIPAFRFNGMSGTAGGMVASNGGGALSGTYGTAGAWVSQLEVVLANGDILQTGRISKRELNRKKGLQTFEGEIYRALDNLIDDNQELIAGKIAADVPDGAGYAAIADVKQRDGSFDLTPLMTGSQGTLGVISEMILQAEFVSANLGVGVAAFSSVEAARDALDQLRALNPAFLEYFDGELFQRAALQGKNYDFYKNAEEIISAVVVVGFDDFSERARAKHLKKVVKALEQTAISVAVADGNEADELMAVREVTAFSINPAEKGAAAPPLFDDAYVPAERFEEFLRSVDALGQKHHVSLPLHGRVLESVYSARPILHLHKVGDKQKVFKLLDEYSTLVDQFGGHLVGRGGEGRVKARFARQALDDDVLQLFASIKAIFDPYGILNPGVKHENDLRQLVSKLRTDYDTSAYAGVIRYN